MIGKISPKGESDPSPEEKLLRSIFGDKAGDVKDSMQILLPYTIPSILYIYIYIFYTIRNTGRKRFFFSTNQLLKCIFSLQKFA